MGITNNKQLYEDLMKLVPPFTERPAKEYLSHDPDKTYQFVLFDTETTCTGKQAEICQLSAICQNGDTFSSYILPNNSVGYYASKVNNLTVETINGKEHCAKI
jgi:DNA polymerase III epsilon subunit-like protein